MASVKREKCQKILQKVIQQWGLLVVLKLDSSLETTGVHVASRTGEIVEDDFPMTVEANSGDLQPNPVTDSVCGVVVDTWVGSEVDTMVHPVDNNVMPWSIGKNKDQPPLDKAMEFDPIRQRRHFAPGLLQLAIRQQDGNRHYLLCSGRKSFLALYPQRLHHLP
ncbi:C3HC zinc finger-like protein [Actinidia rufa]|uniref:C3HC zinc finger-like protein n=1 Tax=Actinidia rufa TaxID=165716 RepID=A0A7J0G527_9ERIC|nr:C3HC zinc finger-like protein [Actinidia rufa]